MRQSSRIATSVQVTGAALALALGSFALAGCGGSGGSAGDAGTAGGSAAAASGETVRERIERQRAELTERRNHWLQTSYESSSQQEEDSWINPGEKDVSTYSRKVTYERDEAGNVTKSVTTSSTESESYLSSDETVKEYELGENGWPVKATVTKTDSFTSLGFTEEEVVNEDGETEIVRHLDEQADHHEENGPEETAVEYSYEYDDEGRVTKVVSSDDAEGTAEFTYRDDGTVASYANTCSYDSYSDEGEEVTVTYSYEAEFNEMDVVVANTQTHSSTDGSSDVTTNTYDDDGNSLKVEASETQADGTKGEWSFVYDLEKDENGNVVKQTCTAAGNGKSAYQHYASNDGGYVKEVFDADGKITASRITYDENWNETAGEEKTYDGPYSVTENTYNDNGYLVKSVITYYDGSTETNEYEVRDDGQFTSWARTDIDGVTRTTTFTFDENGNRIASKTEDGDGSDETATEYVYVENPSNYQVCSRYLSW